MVNVACTSFFVCNSSSVLVFRSITAVFAHAHSSHEDCGTSPARLESKPGQSKGGARSGLLQNSEQRQQQQKAAAAAPAAAAVTKGE